jgi:hypothetical protein
VNREENTSYEVIVFLQNRNLAFGKLFFLILETTFLQKSLGVEDARVAASRVVERQGIDVVVVALSMVATVDKFQ